MVATVTEGFKMAVKRKRKLSDALKGFGQGGLMGYSITQNTPTSTTDTTVLEGAMPSAGGEMDTDELLKLLRGGSNKFDLSKLLKL